jgi:hypothetical protein
MRFYLWAFFAVAPLCSILADCGDQCPPAFEEGADRWKGAMRVRAIKNVDALLYWTFSKRQWNFPLASPLQSQRIEVDIPEVRDFVAKYGYFSLTRPLVAKVTSDEVDLELICCLLKALYEKGAKGEYLNIAVAEIMTKALAYRDLKVGQQIHIPIEREGRVFNEPFTVDQVIDIWGGMPAFGLIPEKAGLASILLFRGTDFSFLTQRGWASMMSDLDISGPGLLVFKQARAKISKWLQRAKALGKKARTMGASLGGAMASYTFIYENVLLADVGSVAVCPPGVASEVIERWALLSAQRRRGLISYVNTGDVVSKVGTLFGTVYCLSPGAALKPIEAHTFLMSSESAFTRALVSTKNR